MLAPPQRNRPPARGRRPPPRGADEAPNPRGARAPAPPGPAAAGSSNRSYVGGCSFAPRAARRFSYRWDRATAMLTLTYRGWAVVTVLARPAFFDLRLRLQSPGRALTRVEFPEALVGDTASVT